MAKLTIKNIPDDLYELIKQSAAAHNRSINNELIAGLEKVFKPAVENIANELFDSAANLIGINDTSAMVREGLIAVIEPDTAQRLARLGGGQPTLEKIPRRQSIQD